LVGERKLGKIIKEGILSDIDSIHRQTIDRAVGEETEKGGSYLTRQRPS